MNKPNEENSLNTCHDAAHSHLLRSVASVARAVLLVPLLLWHVALGVLAGVRVPLPAVAAPLPGLLGIFPGHVVLVARAVLLVPLLLWHVALGVLAGVRVPLPAVAAPPT